MRLAEGPEHLDTAAGRQRSRFPGETTLADARGPHHIHNGTAAGNRAVDHRVEGRHLPAATNQARFGTPDQRIPWTYRKPPAHTHRFVDAFDAHPFRLSQRGGVLD